MRPPDRVRVNLQQIKSKATSPNLQKRQPFSFSCTSSAIN